MKRAILLLLVPLATAGCRSDGGFDRIDSEHGLEFSMSRIIERTCDDARTTLGLVESVPAALGREFTERPAAIRDTYLLYLDPSSRR